MHVDDDAAVVAVRSLFSARAAHKRIVAQFIIRATCILLALFFPPRDKSQRKAENNNNGMANSARKHTGKRNVGVGGGDWHIWHRPNARG